MNKKTKQEQKKEKEKTKAIVLFSGGLDSRLVAKILQEQSNPKLELELLYFKLPFGSGCCNNSECNFNFSQKNLTKLTIIDCTKGKLFNEYINIIKNPKFGFGSGLNPCIDCRIFLLKQTKKYADKNNIHIIATGEVLGERPMSQTSRALQTIDKEIGFEVLRPLSAKLLSETKAEKEKLVNREKFFSISGRNRKIQLELAKKYNINFPTPAGGCLLCDKNYVNKLLDIQKNEKKENKNKLKPEHISSIAGFRHFRSKETKGKIILGRNEQENSELENLNKKLKYKIIIPETPGPTCLYESKEDKQVAEQLVKAYSNKDLNERKKFDEMRI